MNRDNVVGQASRCGIIASGLVPDTSRNLSLKFDTVQLLTSKGTGGSSSRCQEASNVKLSIRLRLVSRLKLLDA